MDKKPFRSRSDLGADKLQCFLKVTFPLSLPGVISGYYISIFTSNVQFLYTKAIREEDNMF